MTAKTAKEKLNEAKSQELSRKKDKKLAESMEKNGVISLIGELLKRQREFLNLSQKDIGDRLNYRYFNFISMIENGTTKIPLNRVPDVVKAYELAPEFMMIFTRALHPETWNVICQIKENNKSFNTGITVADVEKNMIAFFKDTLKEFRLPITI
jgi:transcriptional regulator with XRE-family HTH domain